VTAPDLLLGIAHMTLQRAAGRPDGECRWHAAHTLQVCRCPTSADARESSVQAGGRTPWTPLTCLDLGV